MSSWFEDIFEISRRSVHRSSAEREEDGCGGGFDERGERGATARGRKKMQPAQSGEIAPLLSVWMSYLSSGLNAESQNWGRGQKEGKNKGCCPRQQGEVKKEEKSPRR